MRKRSEGARMSEQELVQVGTVVREDAAFFCTACDRYAGYAVGGVDEVENECPRCGAVVVGLQFEIESPLVAVAERPVGLSEVEVMAMESKPKLN